MATLKVVLMNISSDMKDYIDELGKCGWDNNTFDNVANKSKNDILVMALMAIESIIRPLQKKFPEVFKDIMAVIVGTREKLKAVERYKKEFDDKLRYQVFYYLSDFAAALQGNSCGGR